MAFCATGPTGQRAGFRLAATTAARLAGDAIGVVHRSRRCDPRDPSVHVRAAAGGIINDDVYMVMRLLRSGHRVVYRPEALPIERAA